MGAKRFEPVNVGDKGRRAVAWFLADGLVVSATDANVAGHAMAVVMEALQKTERRLNPHHLKWAKELLEAFPDFPDNAFHHARGNTRQGGR